MIESRGSLPGSFTEFDLTASSLSPTDQRGSLRYSFGAFLLGSAMAGGLSVFMHSQGQEPLAILSGVSSAIQLFTSGYYFGRLKSQR